MQIMGVNYCDFCFSPLEPGQNCGVCGLTHENYKASSGLLKPGTNLLGKYIIGRVLGRGGFGATYVAFSAERRMPVAIKEFFPTGVVCRDKDDEHVNIVSKNEVDAFQKGAARFFEEAQTISKFNMVRNVVSVYEFFQANNTAYYAMEYLEGIDLKGYAAKKGGRISPEEAVTVLHSVCEALVSVHSTGTLHRDISPDNIYISTDGTVKLGGKSVNIIEEWAFKDADEDPDSVKAKFHENPPNVYGYGHTPLYADVIDAIRNDRTPYVTGEDGKNALELILAIYKSAAEGRPVKLPLAECSTMDFAGRFHHG